MRLTLKKLILVLFLISITGFSQAQSPIKVAFINPAPQGNDFWDLVVSFMQASADDLNIDLTVLYTPSHHRNESFKNAIKLIRSADKPDFLIGVFQKKTALQVLEFTQKYNVPFYAINTDVPEERRHLIATPRNKFTHWLGHSLPNDVQAGYLMAKELIEKVGNNGTAKKQTTLLAISGSMDSSASYDRNAGLYKALEEHPEVKLNQLVFTDWSKENAYKKTLGLLNRYPNTNIIWAANDSIALGAVQAIGEKKIMISGTDWSSDGLKAVLNNKLISSYGGHFVEGGFALVLLYDYFHGIDFIEDPGLKINTEFAKIDLTNIEDFNKVFAEQNWGQINFQHFSKHLTPNVKKYDFSWDNIYKNID
ncbi:MAG: ABC transporter substrate-binding protein [Oceanospirillaceae bacterium]|nr:ABC transporter substrate-binding protein [Oceanospirillaceae bacterium]